MDMNDLAKSLFNSKRAEGSSSVSNTKTIQGTVTEDSQDGRVKVVIDGDCVTADGTNEVEIGTVASLKKGDETIILLEGGGVMRPTALGSVGWGDTVMDAATEAQESAVIAAQAASDAEESASAAESAASSASASASSALLQLGTVEDVLGTVNWIAEHGTYALTQDVTVDSSKVYYTRSGSGTTQDPYVYTVVTNPTTSGLSTYYELSIDTALSQYVASHLALTNDGLYVIKDNNGYKALLSNTGMNVFNPSGTSVAQFGPTARIGAATGQNIKIDSDSVDICSGSTVDATFTANKIELAKNSNSAEIEMLAGNASINAKPIYNGPSSQVYFGLESYETKVVGTNTARVSYQGERHLGDGEKSTFSDVYVSRGGVQLTTNSMYLEEDGTASSGSVSSGYIGVSSGNALFSLGTIVMHAGTDGDTSSDTGYVFSNGHGIEPVLLFANENVPMSYAINLSETAANFERLDIMYKNNDGEYDSLTVWNPNGKKVALSSMHAASGGGSIYYKAKTVLISGTVINTASDSSSYFTAQHYTQGNGHVGGSFGDYVNVSHVFGYRKAPLT